MFKCISRLQARIELQRRKDKGSGFMASLAQNIFIASYYADF